MSHAHAHTPTYICIQFACDIQILTVMFLFVNLVLDIVDRVSEKNSRKHCMANGVK